MQIHLITLGVKNLPLSRQFYENLGFKASSISDEHMVLFSCGLCLYPAHLLAKDATVPYAESSFRAVALAHNVASKEEVKKLLDQAVKAGGKLIKPAQDVFWGGHSGYFADPDGHLWEIAWNPHWPLNKDGSIQLPN